MGLKTESTIFSPAMKFLNHMPCELASKQEVNSTSMEMAINVFFSLLHEIAPFASINIFLNIDFFVSAHLARH